MKGFLVIIADNMQNQTSDKIKRNKVHSCCDYSACTTSHMQHTCNSQLTVQCTSTAQKTTRNVKTALQTYLANVLTIINSHNSIMYLMLCTQRHVS